MINRSDSDGDSSDSAGDAVGTVVTAMRSLVLHGTQTRLTKWMQATNSRKVYCTVLVLQEPDVRKGGGIKSALRCSCIHVVSTHGFVQEKEILQRGAGSCSLEVLRRGAFRFDLPSTLLVEERSSL